MLKADDILMPHTTDELAILQQKKVDRFELLWPGVIEKTKEWMEEDDYFRKIYNEYHPQRRKPPKCQMDTIYVCAPPVVSSTIGAFIGVPGSWAMVSDEWFNMITDMADKLWIELIIDEC